MSYKELRVKETKPKGLFISIEGLQKTGKTDFGLSLPDPLFVLNLNQGLEGVIEKHVKSGKEIYSLDLPIPLSKDLPGMPFTILSGAASETWRKAILTLQEVLKDPYIKGIFIDTGSELWDLLRIARLGKLAAVLPVQYTAVNAEFRQLTQLLCCSEKMIVMSHKVKPEYVNDQKTSNFERSGFGDIGFDVQVELKAERDMKIVGDDQFTVTIMDCRFNKDLKGQVLKGKDISFLNIAKLIYPDIEEEYWIKK